jgi:hypothetical protein
LQKRLDKRPNHFLKMSGVHLFCEVCSRNVVHTTLIKGKIAGKKKRSKITDTHIYVFTLALALSLHNKQAKVNYKDIVNSKSQRIWQFLVINQLCKLKTLHFGLAFPVGQCRVLVTQCVVTKEQVAKVTKQQRYTRKANRPRLDHCINAINLLEHLLTDAVTGMFMRVQLLVLTHRNAG